MKKIWFLIIIALFIQEPASTDAAIFQVRNLHLNFWLVNLLWLIATFIDIYFGYKIGKWVQLKFKEKKIIKKSQKWASRIEDFVGKKGEKFALVLLGIINFPYLNSFLMSWTEIPFKNAFFLIFIGDVLYWSIEWGINIGVRGFFKDPHTALYIIVSMGLVFSVISKMVLNKVLKVKKNNI